MLDSVELDFRCAIKSRDGDVIEYRDIGKSGSPRDFMEFAHPQLINADGRHLVYPFIAMVPCTHFTMVPTYSERFFQCTARAWCYTVPEPENCLVVPTALYVVGSESTVARAYMSPGASLHFLWTQDYAKHVPFDGGPNLR